MKIGIDISEVVLHSVARAIKDPPARSTTMKFLSLRRNGRHTTSSTPASRRPDRGPSAQRHDANQRAKALTGCFKQDWTL